MGILLCAGVLVNMGILALGIWATLSPDVKDGIIIKIGIALLSFSALHSILHGEFSPVSLWTDVGILLIGVGVFLRTVVFPHLHKKLPYIKRVDTTPHTLRRSSDV